MSAQLIDTQRTRDPAPAREDRLSKRLAERVGVRLLARGGQRYADAVIEGLGDPSKAWMTCSTCKRPYVQEWAVREMGHAMNRAMGHPQVQVQVLALIQQELGCRDVNEARVAVSMYRSVEGVDPAGVVEMAQKVIEGHGGRVLWPASGPSLPQDSIGPGDASGAPETGPNGNGANLGGLASESP